MTLSKLLQKHREHIDPNKFDDLINDLKDMFKPPEDNLYMESTVSHRDSRPIVSVVFGKYQFQLSPEKSREIGNQFILAAHAAEMDSFIYQFFAGEQKIDKNQVRMLIAYFREWREKHSKINELPSESTKQ